MKILAFTDIHSDEKLVKEIKAKAKTENPDLLICCGDLSEFGKRLDKIGELLNELDKPVYIIPGNHETEEEIKGLCKKYKNFVNLHKGMIEFDNLVFFGYGGGGFSRIDESFERIVAKLKRAVPDGKKLILILHSPPYKTRLDSLGEHYVGNKSYRRFIEETSPVLVLAGHIHENELKQDKIKNSVVINPGCSGLIIEI